MNELPPSWLLSLSDRLYRLLLAAYPADFRRAYERHMAQVFRDSCRDAYVQHGWFGLIGWWLRTLLDLAGSALKEHLTAPRSRAARMAPVPIDEGGQPMPAPQFDYFTKRAKQSLQFATEAASSFNHPHISTAHILLGLIQEREGLAGYVLSELGITLPQARQAVEQIAGPGSATKIDYQDLSPRAKRVITYAVKEAKLLNHHYIGTEHLLLGITALGEGTAAGALELLGVSPMQIRERVMETVRRGPKS